MWTKGNFWFENLQRPKSKLKAMKGYPWSMETQGCLKCFFLQLYIRSMFQSSSNLAETFDLQVWIHKPNWKKIEHKSSNSEKQSTEKGAFVQTQKKINLSSINHLLYKVGWAQNHVMKQSRTLNQTQKFYQNAAHHATCSRNGYSHASAIHHLK